MKKLLTAILLFSILTTTAQEYDNLGQVLGIHNSIMGESIIRGETGFSISKITYKPIDANLIDYTRLTTTTGLDINPTQHFHIKTQFFFDLIQSDDVPPWLSNMYYQIGWYNWKNKTISFGYENYGPNRFFKSTNWGTNFMRGAFFTSYNIDLLNDHSNLKFDDYSQIRITPLIRYSIEYPDKLGIEKGGNHKVVIGSSVRWNIAKKFYIEGAAFYYPNSETKLPWDPDFTYGFGYFNWQAFKMNISYGNWIANRFPGNKLEMKHSPLNGELKVMFTWAL